MNKQPPTTAYLDELWRKVIRLMFSYRCAGRFTDKCQHEGHDAHHVVPRSDKRHRWHPLNGILLCDNCHKWAHAHPKKFKRWLKKKIPEVYKNSRGQGFAGHDQAYIKHQLLVMRSMLSRVARNGGGSDIAIFPIIIIAIVVSFAVAWIVLPH